MPKNNNLELWESLEKTDPKFTKQFTRGGGFSGTSINGTYILKRLTEAFGPCGEGWRFVVDKEEIVEGHKLKSGDVAKLHYVRGHLEYIRGVEWKKTSEQCGQTMLVGENNRGTFFDEEAPKKSFTDCVSKCAVMLGIGGDIYMGLFDDNKYVNDRTREEAAKTHDAPTQQKSPAEKYVEQLQNQNPNPPQQTEERAPDPKNADDKKRASELYNAVMAEIKNAKTLDELAAIGNNALTKEGLKFIKAGWPSRHQDVLDAAAKRKQDLTQPENF